MSNFYESSMSPEELICNGCESVYPNNRNERDERLQITMGWMIFVMCPVCTKKVLESAGLTDQVLKRKMNSIRRAETENNRKREVKEGVRCYKCEEKFARDVPRVKVDECSNTKAYHLNCYETIR